MKYNKPGSGDRDNEAIHVYEVLLVPGGSQCRVLLGDGSGPAPAPAAPGKVGKYHHQA